MEPTELADSEEEETAEEAEADVMAGVDWEVDCWVAAVLEVEHLAEASPVEAKVEGTVAGAELEEAVAGTVARKAAAYWEEAAEEAPGVTRILGTAGRRRLQACSTRTPRIQPTPRYTDFPMHSSCKTTWPSIHMRHSIPRTRECTSYTRQKATTQGEAMQAL